MSSDLIANKLRTAVDQAKSRTGMQVGLPSVRVDVYELERMLDALEALQKERDELQAQADCSGHLYE